MTCEITLFNQEMHELPKYNGEAHKIYTKMKYITPKKISFLPWPPIAYARKVKWHQVIHDEKHTCSHNNFVDLLFPR